MNKPLRDAFATIRSACMLSFVVRRRWVGAIGLGAAAAATTSVFACQQLVGIPGDPPVPTATNACGLPYGNNACASCVATSCCTESSACAADPVCAAYEACLGKSNGDWQLRSQCAIDNMVGGSSEVSPLSACVATHCTNECGLTCGGLAANATQPDMAAACQQCVADNDNACASEQACASSEVCDAFLRCRFACETGDCFQGCLSAHNASADAFTPFIGVFQGSCSVPCAYGQDWTCVGRVNWPSIRSATTTLTVDVEDYLTPQKGVSGVTVSVCEGQDTNCSPPLVPSGLTNDAGRVVMPAVPDKAPLGAAGLNGYLRLTSPSTVPWLYYWGFPLSESAFALTDDPPFFHNAVLVLTPDEQQTLAEGVSMPLYPDFGNLAIVVVDCLGRPASGVTVRTNVNGPQAVYDLSLTKMATDNTGLVTFANVPAGSVDLTALPVALAGKASSHVTVVVRAGFETGVTMFPTP